MYSLVNLDLKVSDQIVISILTGGKPLEWISKIKVFLKFMTKHLLSYF